MLAQTATRGEAYTFAFHNAEITDVLQEVLGAAEIPFVVDPGVSGRMSLRIEQRLTRDQLLAVLEAALATHGVSIVRNGDQIQVVPEAKARTTAGVRRSTEAAGTAGFELVAAPLAYAQPSEVARALEAISAANTVVYSNDKLGVLLLGGSGSSLKAALDALKVFDQSAFQASKIRWFELSQAQASVVATELDRIVQGAGLVGVAVVPLKRLNGVIVFGRSSESLDELSKWVARLDTPGKEAASTLWVYHPRNASAETLSQTLTSVLGVQSRMDQSTLASAGEGAPQSVSGAARPAVSFGTGDEEVRIGVDKDTNTLLVMAPAPRWVQIQRILNEVDRPPRQVLIEASIVEVTLGKQFQFGVDWATVSDDLRVAAVNNAQGSVGPSFPGLSVTYLTSDIRAAVNALGSRTSIEVVSAPKIIALDNRTARLQVGDQVPVTVQTSQSTDTNNAPLVSSIDYRSTGVILVVTPRISGEDQLVLQVSQEVSSVARTATSGIDSPTIQQRRFESTLVINNGGVVALGGLISSNRTASGSGVPWLKDIPIAGALFQSQGRDDSRSELIVLLTARILSDRAGSDRAVADLLADMRELQGRGLLPLPK